MNTASFRSGDAARRTAGVIPKEPKQQNFRNHRERLGGIVPGKGDLAELLGLDDTSSIDGIVRGALLDLVVEVTSSPGKTHPRTTGLVELRSDQRYSALWHCSQAMPLVC